MAQAVTWGLKSVTFTPTGGAAESFTDLTDMSFKDTIDMQKLLTDANVNKNLMFGTGGETEFTIKSTDTSLAWRTTSSPGTPGTVVAVWGKRAAGKGYVSGSDKTQTFPNAVLGERSGTAAAANAGSCDVSFSAYDAGNGLFAIT